MIACYVLGLNGDLVGFGRLRSWKWIRDLPLTAAANQLILSRIGVQLGEPIFEAGLTIPILVFPVAQSAVWVLRLPGFFGPALHRLARSPVQRNNHLQSPPLAPPTSTLHQ